MYEFLAKAPLLAGLAQEDLDRLGEQAVERRVGAGEVLFEEGDAGDACYFIKEGGLAVTKRSGGQEVLLAERGPGEVLGEMALIDDAPRSATVSASEDSLLLVVGKESFQNLLASSPTAAMNTLHTFAHRLRATRATLHQSEKMAALGTMTAGIAHELNNPASAANRAAEQLDGTLHASIKAALNLMTPGANGLPLDTLRELHGELAARAADPPVHDALTRSDLESALEDVLENAGLDNAWEFAPLLVGAGYGPDEISGLVETFGDEPLPSLLAWMTATFDAFSLLNEIQTSTGRLSEIVGAMKQYTYLDRAPVQDVDIHEGIESTLTILGHKLRDGITLTRDYAPDLPHITAYASELAQVWTNLIDNAIDAMGGQGGLTLRTGRDDDYLVVEITDDGPGIPADAQSRLFEPFYTTKAPGEGTGLGLHISHNIVVTKHRGVIRFDSRPGQTTFEVRLPIHSDLSA